MGFLRFENFKKIVNNNPWIRHIELSNWGEIFLNPDLLKIIKYSYQKNVVLSASNGVNLNTVKEQVLEALVKYKFEYLTCSIDGATPETYATYRWGGNFENVIMNIKKINYYKRKNVSKLPHLVWQFIAFGHNEHEIRIARQMAKDLNMDFFVKLSRKGFDGSGPFSPIRDKDLIKRETGLGVFDRKDYKKKFGRNYIWAVCTQLWKSPQINFDGTVLGCCINYWGNFGNAFRDGLLNCLNNENMNYARQMLLGKKKSRMDIPCTTCVIYTEMKKDSNWLNKSDIENKVTEIRSGTVAKRKIFRQKYDC